MTYIVDRRTNAKNKNAVNRQRFLQRYKKYIKKAVSDAIDKRSITDMDRGKDVIIPGEDISEPYFHHGHGGEVDAVYTGNDQFVKGDKLYRPPSGTGGDGDGGSDGGFGEDEFAFTITREEFLDYLFEDLALPNLHKTRLKGIDSYKWRHAGYTSEGPAAKLSIPRTFRQAKARRIALAGESRRKLREAEEKLEGALNQGDEVSIGYWLEEVRALQKRVNRVAFLDTYDLRYRLNVKQPIPISQAVMFCLMDVSGSMDKSTKNLAKRFYLLLYLFLTRHYKKIDIVWIRYHTLARESSEDEFFYSRETGGTVASTALDMMKKIIADRYPSEEWNIYGAMASDGDNFPTDSPICQKLLAESILPISQYFAYIEIAERPQHMWEHFAQLNSDCFAQRRIRKADDIFPVFHDLFKKHE